MVQVKNSRGKGVNVEIIGLSELQRNLQAKEKRFLSLNEIALARGANFIQQELQESIVGNRAELKSVDSGKLANSINVTKEASNIFVIAPDKIGYPNGGNTQSVMRFLEFGTSKITPRRHMRNTFARVKDQVEKIVLDTLKF